MTTYSRAVERQRREIRGTLLDALRVREQIIVDRQVSDGLVLHPPKQPGTLPYVTDLQGREYNLGPTGRLIVGRN
ncbi:MAG: hypothetical protein ABFD83_13830 [Armatimonadota bacterium]